MYVDIGLTWEAAAPGAFAECLMMMRASNPYSTLCAQEEQLADVMQELNKVRQLRQTEGSGGSDAGATPGFWDNLAKSPSVGTSEM